jgi:sporulation-control protein spo0M
MVPTALATSIDRLVDRVVVRADAAVDNLLRALKDLGFRAILDVTGDEALSASEISERCDLPRSSTYRS